MEKDNLKRDNTGKFKTGSGDIDKVSSSTEAPEKNASPKGLPSAGEKNSFDNPYHKVDEKKKSSEYEKAKDNEKIHGIFRYISNPGQTLSFSYKAPYRGAPVQHFDLVDGEEYTIPIGVAKHLRREGAVPLFKRVRDSKGVSRQHYAGIRKRFTFDSLEVIDTIGYIQPRVANVV